MNEKSFLGEIKNIFYSFWRAIIWWLNKNLMKIPDTSFKLRDYKGRKVTAGFLEKFLIWRYLWKRLQISPKSDFDMVGWLVTQFSQKQLDGFFWFFAWS